MDFDPVFLSRLQFGFVITFHIIFPSFTIGLGAWLATIEGVRLATGNPVYRRVFDFWLKVFALSFGMGVVTGIVMAFQFGTNWSVLAERTGSIQGPLLGYEAFTAFILEATFFGVMLLGRDRVSPRVYFFACCMVALGTMFSSFWILANNSWMQVPIGHTIVDGKIIPSDGGPYLPLASGRQHQAGPVRRGRRFRTENPLGTGRRDRRTRYRLHLRLEHHSCRPGDVAARTRKLRSVPGAAVPGVLQPGPGSRGS